MPDADSPQVRVSQMALVSGMADTRATLARWNDRPAPVLGVWLLGAFAISVVLLVSVWLISRQMTPDPTPVALPGIRRPATPGLAGWVLFRNSLVLALHALACVAGFIAGSSLPLQADHYSGWYRKVHEHAGRFAILFVTGATLFSLVTQALVLGQGAATISAQLGLGRGELLLALLPHALPELLALFLPLAAWIIASRRGAWHELLAATAVTVAIAVPVLIASACVEVFVTPHLLVALAS